MILLFAGSTPIIRGALAEKIVDEHSRWRHLAVEELAESAESGSGEDFDPEKLFEIVCNCAKTMEKENYHLILSLTDATELLPMIRETIEEDFLSVYLGDPKENTIEAFDHIIDTSAASLNDIYAFIKPLIEDSPDAEKRRRG